VDLAKARADRAALATERDPAARALLVHQLVVSAARALLITKGVEAATDRDVPDLFERHFLDTGIVAESFRPVLAGARRGAETLAALGDRALAFVQEIEGLYASMDDTLQFHPRVPPRGGEDDLREPAKVDLVKDLRGVACPMNFVKTKVALSQLQTGQVLQVLLDDGEPVENVPRSVAAEGHRVLDQTRVTDHWSVVIRKA
jgi:sulfite reductase (ferredoxin)